jgi:hypothetical protein
MQKVGLSSAVSYGPFVKSLPQSLLEIADNYFGGKKVQVIAGYRQGRSEGVIDLDEQISNRKTVITRLLYAASALPLIALAANKTSLKKSVALSLAVPALMLIGKIALRSLYPFHHVEEDRTTKFVGEDSSVRYLYPNKGTALEFERLYLLTYKEMADLRIKPIDQRSLLHNLPLTSNEYYSVPPRIHRGESELSEYNDSVFEYGRYNDLFYKVIRKKSGELPLQFDLRTQLSRDQVVNLRIISQSLYKGVSIRPEYANSYFSLEQIRDTYYVTRKDLELPSIPFNEVVILSQLHYAALALIDTNMDYEPVPGQKWGIFNSAYYEFERSRFLVSKLGSDYSVVRMMQPQVKYIDV